MSSRPGPSRKAIKTEPVFVVSDDEYEAAPNGDWRASKHSGSSNKRDQAKHENGHDTNGTADWEAKEALKVALAKLDAEIKSVVAQLEPLQALHTSLVCERRTLENQLSTLSHRPSASISHTKSKTGKASPATDYQSASFPWSAAILSTLKSTFGLPSFRLCQKGVINAAMDDRDIVCVMPTGGGKSLTYQLPAVVGQRGLTVVISPLLALIWDQVRALKELEVECVMMTGSTSKEEQNDIYRRLEEGGRNGRKEIRLCYLTPEKISKSKRLMSVLEKVNSAGRLKRFVIDEAHCCSQLGHDFRPDYKKLSVLKGLFPRVPIQAVTATLSIKTLPDLLKILRLPPICDGQSANSSGTVFFSAPLYRSNLHYQVKTKPASAKTAIEKMGSWIKGNHSGESGIIYCLSKKDAETVANALTEWSNGDIKTGVYHAGIHDHDKEKIHVKWRQGKVNCICATIAFGLGIDKGNVRYVIHHSMSKSLDGYYQETGRAGRDGAPSDCVLFFRSQDAARLASLIYGDVDGTSKLQEMTKFAVDLKTCRKVAFAKYFSTSANLSANAWDHAGSLSSTTDNSITTCGICDNCIRAPTSVMEKDVTLDAWKVLKVLNAVQGEGGRVTLAVLADLVRGLGGGSFAVSGGKKRKVQGKGSLDVTQVAGGKVEMSKDHTESLLLHMSLTGYLEESYHATSYAVNVYLIPSSRSLRLSRLSIEQVQSGQVAPPIKCIFPKPGGSEKLKAPSKARSKQGKRELVKLSEEMSIDGGEGEGGLGKRNGVMKSPQVIELDDEDEPDDYEEPDEEMEEVIREGGFAALLSADDEEDEGDDGWGGKKDGGWHVIGRRAGSGESAESEQAALGGRRSDGEVKGEKKVSKRKKGSGGWSDDG